MSCFGGRDEQIYLLEVTVDRLKLAARLYREEFSTCVPTIKIKFIDLGAFEVARRCPCPAEDGTESTEYDENKGLIYGCGVSCMFIKKPRDLVASMKSQPLRIGVFRGEETFPLAEASLPLLGCLCDQVAMAGNDAQHRPKPYELAGNYCMRDPGEALAGSISILLRLTLFGSSIVSYYQLYEDSCIFKNNYDGELRVTRVIDGDSEENKSETFTMKEGNVLATIGGDKPQKNDANKK
ncbi:hypothetical protein QAD02_005132 [Eretmocerus hayati]|uniref:Uncharacterized protein n=1 Tax=Eretmocerus hayati TaxID=131215 RepID=A0ACC2NRG6_9HYME|nr:hypothetical protein QAD02_005132 [Eretmocerus hayati]